MHVKSADFHFSCVSVPYSSNPCAFRFVSFQFYMPFHSTCESTHSVLSHMRFNRRTSKRKIINKLSKKKYDGLLRHNKRIATAQDSQVSMKHHLHGKAPAAGLLRSPARAQRGSQHFTFNGVCSSGASPTEKQPNAGPTIQVPQGLASGTPCNSAAGVPHHKQTRRL